MQPALAGIHLEGPFLSEQKSGAHPVEQLRDEQLIPNALYERLKERLVVN